jgi:HlyD family secretion protein
MKTPPMLARLGQSARRHPLWTALGAVVLIVVLVGLVRAAKPAAAGTEYFTVRRGDLMVSVVEGGTLQAVNETSIRNEVEGTSRIIYIVPEGTYVQRDDLLVELDSMQAQDAVNQQQISFEKAQFALIQAENQLAIQRSQVESDVRAAELKVQFAKLDLDRYLEGEQNVNLLTASNNITQITEQLAIDQETLRWSEELAERGFETKNVLDRDRLTVTNRHLNLQIQEMQLWMLQNYDIPKRQAEYESAWLEAGKDLERVKQQGANRIAQYTADLLTQSNTLALSAAKLERDRKNLEATRITAPQDGLVVYPMGDGRFSSESMIEEGATVRNRQELIKLPDVARMKVTVKIHEASINMIRAGQPAFVVLDSMPERRFRAVVDRVALMPDAQARWGNPNLKVYNTEVVLVDPLPDVKPVYPPAPRSSSPTSRTPSRCRSRRSPPWAAGRWFTWPARRTQADSRRGWPVQHPLYPTRIRCQRGRSRVAFPALRHPGERHRGRNPRPRRNLGSGQHARLAHQCPTAQRPAC